jgi:hypothetical protein
MNSIATLRAKVTAALTLIICATPPFALAPAVAATCGNNNQTNYTEIEINKLVTADIPGVWIIRIQGNTYQGLTADE